MDPSDVFSFLGRQREFFKTEKYDPHPPPKRGTAIFTFPSIYFYSDIITNFSMHLFF